MSRIIMAVIVCTGLLLGLTTAEEAPSHPRQAIAELIDRDGNVIGTATFTEAEHDAVRIKVLIVAFAKGTAGEHGIHI